MPYDGLVLSAVKQELSEKLVGARIDRIFQPRPDEIVLIFHSPNGRLRLLLSAHAQNARVHMTKQTKENPPAPPTFCMVMRKHLEGGRLRAVLQSGLDRVITFIIESRDELGRTANKKLICEIMGKHSNVILVNKQDDIILDGIKRYSHSVSRHREVLPGRTYLSPPEHGKLNPQSIEEENFYQICLEHSLDSKIVNILQKRFDGFSTILCRELVYRAGLPADLKLDHCGEYEFRSLWRAFKEIVTPLSGGHFQPCLVINPQGRPMDFSAFELNHYQEPLVHGEMNELLDIYFSYKEKKEAENAARQSLLNLIQKEQTRLHKKLALQEESIRESDDMEKLRLNGELITANIYRLRKGSKEEVLENFYEPEGTPLVVPMDPDLTPSENAQKYFKKYNKAKSTREKAEYMAGQTKNEVEYLEGVENSLYQAEGIQELEEIRNELTDQGYIQRQQTARGKKPKKERQSPKPLNIVSSDGLTILIGKNNRQNDFVTMKLAQDEDLWFHTKDIPGSHVLVRANGKPVPESTMKEAASLAAYFSKANQSQNVPVDYTLKRNVSKPSGSKPGFVIYVNQRTIYVNPDLALTVLQKDTP